jgi:hypothetical protein
VNARVDELVGLGAAGIVVDDRTQRR